MPDDIGTETIRSDAPSANESPFADAVEETVVEIAGEQEPTGEPAQDPQVPDDEDKPDAEAETDAAEELKVVVSIKGGRAVIGVRQPSSDPHIETFEGHDLPALAQDVVGVTVRAKEKWQEAPKHPAYARPAPPPKRRNRRQQGAAQGANAETQEEAQQTLRLF